MKRELNKKMYIIAIIIICALAFVLRTFVFASNGGMSTPLIVGTVFCIFGAYYACSKPKK